MFRIFERNLIVVFELHSDVLELELLSVFKEAAATEATFCTSVTHVTCYTGSLLHLRLYI